MPSPSDYASTARATARSILGQPPFSTPPHRPGLAARIVDDIGHWISSLFHWIYSQVRHFIGHPVASSAHGVLGGWYRVALIVGAVAIGGVVAWLLVVARRRRTHPNPGEVGPSGRTRDPRRTAALLDEARRAWDRGDLDTALRLRFEAGLERLEDRGVVLGRTNLTTSELSSRLHSSTFDQLANVHTNVAYGGAAATDDEVSTAFARWPEVAEARP